MRRERSRRQFLNDTVTLAAAAAAMPLTAGTARAATPAAEAMPMISLGKLQVSRVFLGSNPFFGFSHGNPQANGKEMTEWYTPERIMAVLDEAADLGINAVWTPCYDNWIRIWNDYREKGGKLKNWIGQPDKRPMEKEIMKAVNNGATAVCVQGVNIDEMVNGKRWDQVQKWIELIKENGLPAGMATHRATTHLEAEEKGLPTDFYHQTMYRPDNYVKEGLEESLKTIEKLEKPVVCYKVLGAGRVRPQDTLPAVFKRLKAKDGICVGVFPKKNPNEIKENAELTKKLSG